MLQDILGQDIRRVDRPSSLIFFYLSSRKVKRAAYELGWRSSSDFGRDIYDCGIAQLNVYSLEYTATILHTSINKLTPLPRC